jgi:hypothetical protein
MDSRRWIERALVVSFAFLAMVGIYVSAQVYGPGRFDDIFLDTSSSPQGYIGNSTALSVELYSDIGSASTYSIDRFWRNEGQHAFMERYENTAVTPSDPGSLTWYYWDDVAVDWASFMSYSVDADTMSVGAGTITLSGNAALAGAMTFQGETVISLTSFSDGDATPSVDGGTYFGTNNTGATTITTFDDGTNNQLIYVKINDVNTTVQCSGPTLYCNGGSDVTARESLFICLVTSGTWYCTVSHPDGSDLLTEGDVAIDGGVYIGGYDKGGPLWSRMQGSASALDCGTCSASEIGDTCIDEDTNGAGKTHFGCDGSTWQALY